MLCLARCNRIPSCLVQQVAHYNDRYVKYKKPRPEVSNRMRKTRIIRENLAAKEPTEHDVLFGEAVRFREAEFRSQMMALRQEWAVKYGTLTLPSAVERETARAEAEAERQAFIEEIKKEQKIKADTFSESLSDSFAEVSEDDYRRNSQLISPDQEVADFLEEQKAGYFVTPETFDATMDSLFSEASYTDTILKKEESESSSESEDEEYKLRRFTEYNVEVVLPG